jgi:hypothetical protein
MLDQAQGNPEVVTNHDDLMPDGGLERFLRFGIFILNFGHNFVGNNFFGTNNRLALGFVESIQQMSWKNEKENNQSTERENTGRMITEIDGSKQGTGRQRHFGLINHLMK